MPDRKVSNISLGHQQKQRGVSFAVGGWQIPERGISELISVDGRTQEETVEDIVGDEVSRQRIRDLYGYDGHMAFWKFAKSLKEEGGSRFCVSYTERDFELERMRFYGVEEGVMGGDLKIVYLGQGKTPFTPEILNIDAAKTLGFSVLKLPKTNEVTDK